MSEAPENCPFCYSPVDVCDMSGGFFQVICPGCEARGPENEREVAVHDWNQVCRAARGIGESGNE